MAENNSIYVYEGDEEDTSGEEVEVVADVDINEDELQTYEPPALDREQLSHFEQYDQKEGGE